MHEIKFRAWNKENKIMCYDNEDNSEDYWDGTCESPINLINKCFTCDSYIFMQYTGLHDKNGTEIYEGDIVRIDKEDYKYIVKFYDGCFVGVSIYDEHYEQAKILGNLFTLEIEVIGNIYDNPKLLENKQDKE